jgi:cholesterol transport system auxiliary component
MAPLPAVLLADVEAPVALETTAVLYRLGYADAQQLRPYAQARWSMAPAQLLRGRLRAVLGQRRSVLTPLDAAAPGTLTLRVELEEFSQWFDTTTSSAALVRVRATLGRTGSPSSLGSPGIAAKPVAQTSFVLQHPSNTADAAGGVRAMALATDALVQQLDAWLQQTTTAEAATP